MNGQLIQPSLELTLKLTDREANLLRAAMSRASSPDESKQAAKLLFKSLRERESLQAAGAWHQGEAGVSNGTTETSTGRLKRTDSPLLSFGGQSLTGLTPYNRGTNRIKSKKKSESSTSDGTVISVAEIKS
jgi:hypothetical protein